MNNTKKAELIKAFTVFCEIFYKWPETQQVVYDEWKEDQHKRDENGRFAKTDGGSSATSFESDKEIQAKIDSLKNIDWNKDNILPSLSKLVLEKYGLKDKPILLKKNIINRNRIQHSDISDSDAVRILGNALYKTEVVLKGNNNKYAYHNFITRTDDEHSDLVLVELSDEKEHYEIVHYFVVRNKSRKELEKIK